MNTCGKKARRESGLTKAECHRANHTPKSPEKIKRMGWTRDKTQSTNYRHQQA